MFKVRVVLIVYSTGSQTAYEKVCELPRLPVRGEEIDVAGRLVGHIEECSFNVGSGDAGCAMSVKCWEIPISGLTADELLSNGFTPVRKLEIGK